MLRHYSNLFCRIQARPTPTMCVLLRGVHKSPITFRAKLLDGTKLSRSIRAELKTEVDKWVAAGNRPPKLVALLVGNDPASQIYVRNKMKAAKEIGIISVKQNLPNNISQSELIKKIELLNADPSVDGVLVQLPLPPHIAVRDVCNAVAPDKDVDGFNVVNVGRLCLNMDTFVPCTVLGVRELIRVSGIETLGKRAVVCGRSKNVGMPMAMLLQSNSFKGEGTLAMDATTTICHRNTPVNQLREATQCADIIITATGVPNLITADMVKEGACVIDIGISRVIDSRTGKKKLVGDVDFEGVCQVAGYITPVPGGVGPMTVAMLMKNTLRAAKKFGQQFPEDGLQEHLV